MSVESVALEAGKWLLIGGGLSIVVIPAVQHWLLREYSTKDEEKEFHKQVKKSLADLRTDMQTWLAKQDDNHTRLVDLEVKVGVFWRMVERSTADMLHRDDDAYHIDDLLERLPAENLTPEERGTLVGVLHDIEKSGDVTDGQRVAAVLLRASIYARYRSELGNAND